jgi:alpha-N-arabinofuranosidase
MEYLRDHADYLAIHTYVGNQADNFADFMASSMDLDERIKVTEGVLDGALAGQTPRRKIHIAWDEWNVWYRARGERGRRILEEHYNLEDALVVATFLNSFVNHAHVVKMANMAQLVNVIAPIFTSETGMFLQTIYYPLQLFAANTRGKALALYVDGPKYKSTRFDGVPYLDASASYENGSLVMNVVNRHRDQAIETEFEIQDKQFAGTVTASEVNGPDIKAQNDFGKTVVKTVAKSAQADARKLRYTFPAHSYTMLKVGVR